MNIVLIGYRGTGKSIVGKRLAHALSLTYVEMDALIVTRARCSIADLVATQGWDSFRQLESEVLRELIQRTGQIIDTGGGVIEREENRLLLSQNNLVLWLRAPIDTLRQRLEGCSSRPSLTTGKTPVDEIETVLVRRDPIYCQLAHCSFDTSMGTPDELALTLAAYFHQWQANGSPPPPFHNSTTKVTS